MNTSNKQMTYVNKTALTFWTLGAALTLAPLTSIDNPFQPSTASAQAKQQIGIEDAVNDPSLRQAYLDSISPKQPGYVLSVEYMTPQTHMAFRRIGVEFPPKTLGMAIPIEKGYSGSELRIAGAHEVEKGVKSKIYLLPSIFKDHSKLASPIEKKEFYEGLAAIHKNLIENNLYLSAKLFSEGIAGYSIEKFKDRSGEYDLSLYAFTIMAIVHANEYRMLAKSDIAKTNRSVQEHIKRLSGEVARYHLNAHTLARNSDMSREFIDAYSRDFSLNKLLSRPVK